MKPTQRRIATSAHVVTYYVDNRITQDLCQKYGSRLEEMYKLSKLTFRAALATFAVDVATQNQSIKSQKDAEQLAISAIDGIHSSIATDDEEVFNAIVELCTTLPLSCIDNLIISLSEQIFDNCWSEDPASQSGQTSDPLDELLSLTEPE